MVPKFEKDGSKCSIEHTGSMGELIDGCCSLVHELYCSMAANDPNCAFLFRYAIMQAMASDSSPMWDASKRGTPKFELYMSGFQK